MRLKFDFNSTEDDTNMSSVEVSNNNAGSADNQEDFGHHQYNDDNGAEEIITDDFQTFDNNVVQITTPTTHEEVHDHKYRPPQTVRHDQSARCYTNNLKKQKPTSTCASSSSQTEILNTNEDASIVQLNSSDLSVMPTPSLTTTSASSSTVVTPVITTITSENSSNKQSNAVRDQWDAFGELVATEFRNLNSEVSRKRLKRKIMQAMLEVGEEDDKI